MDIYNLNNIDLNNIKRTDFNVDVSKKLFLIKILRFLKIYDLYDFYRNNLYNHPSFSLDGIDTGSNSLFNTNNIPNNIENTFSSINEDNFKYTIINNILLQNAIANLQNNKQINEKFKIESIKTLEQEVKKLSSNLITDTNNILSKNYLFIPIFDESSFFVFITNNDSLLLQFIKNMIDYFLVTEKTNYKIHYDIIKSEILKLFSIEISDIKLDELIYTIKDGITAIPFIFDTLFQKGYEQKYLGISVILYIVYFNIGLYSSFVKNNNLFGNDLENSQIFI